MTSEDGGFNEWLNVFWLPRVYDGKPHGAQVRLAPVPTQTKIVKDGDGARQFTRLADEGGKPVHQGMHDVPAERTKPGGDFSDGTAIAVRALPVITTCPSSLCVGMAARWYDCILLIALM